MYEARITREHRTALLLLSDQSGSMSEEVVFQGESVSKAEAVTSIINMFIDEIINRSRREEGVRDYFDIAVIGYSGDGVEQLLCEDGFISVSNLIKKPVRTHNRTVMRTLPSGNQVASSVCNRYWIEPKAVGNTPMGKALSVAEKMIRQWCSQARNESSFPPVVINITDGEASDAGYDELCETAEKIKRLSTSDGNVLMINIHLAAAGQGGVNELCFPSDSGTIPQHRYAKLLYDMSSVMPETYNSMIRGVRPDTRPPYRAMSFNSAVDELFPLLCIGSLSVSLTA